MVGITEVRNVAKKWWVVLVQGILLILLGITFVVNPFETLLVLVQFLAAYWLVSGIFSIVDSITGNLGGSRLWGFLSGLISILAGVLMFANPYFATYLTTTFWIYFIAFSSIFYGVFQLIEGNNVRKLAGMNWSWGNILLGIFNIVFGFLLFAFPIAAATAYIWIAGIWAIFGGIVLLMIAFRLKKVANDPHNHEASRDE